MTDLREIAPVSSATDDPPFADGALVVYRSNRHGPDLAVASSPQRDANDGTWSYWLNFLQEPARGVPSGGAGGMFPARTLRAPETTEEQLLALQYHTAARVVALTEDLAHAQDDAHAVTTALRVFREQGEVRDA